MTQESGSKQADFSGETRNLTRTSNTCTTCQSDGKSAALIPEGRETVKYGRGRKSGMKDENEARLQNYKSNQTELD